MPTLYLPSSPSPASVTIRTHQRTKANTAASGKIISREYGGQSFEMTLAFPPMTRTQFSPISAFLASIGGRNGIFYVEVPNDMAGATGELVGNFANFSDDWKLHMITAVSPTTVTPLARAGGFTLVTDPVYMRCSLARDVQEIRLDRMGLIKFELDLVERL